MYFSKRASIRAEQSVCHFEGKHLIFRARYKEKKGENHDQKIFYITSFRKGLKEISLF
jgi:hypothetical protein